MRYRKTSNEGFTASRALITDICLAGRIEKHLSGKQNGKETVVEEGGVNRARKLYARGNLSCLSTVEVI